MKNQIKDNAPTKISFKPPRGQFEPYDTEYGQPGIGVLKCLKIKGSLGITNVIAVPLDKDRRVEVSQYNDVRGLPGSGDCEYPSCLILALVSKTKGKLLEHKIGLGHRARLGLDESGYESPNKQAYAKRMKPILENIAAWIDINR